MRLAFALAALAWLPSLWGAFQFDDYNVIVRNPGVHSWAGFLDGLGSSVRPVLNASYTLGWTSGLGAAGFHAFNVALHVINTLLIFGVGLQLSRRWAVSGAGAALAAALLFALHPVQTEAVTYVSGRSSSLAAAFYLAALLVYLRGGHGLASGTLFLLAVGAKETALTLPFALLLCELTARDRPAWREIARRQLPHWCLFVVIVVLALLNQRYRHLLDFALAQRSFADNFLTQVQGVGYLVSRLLAPHRLNIDPALPVLTAWDAGTMLQAILFLALTASALFNLRKRPWLAFGVLWFFLQLAPTNSIVPRLDVANERQLYLAWWGLAVATVFQLREAAVPFMKPALAVILATFVFVGIDRQLDYRSEVSLWQGAVRESPWNARAWNNLGYAYELAGERERAVAAYGSALALAPADYRAAFNLERSCTRRSGGC